MNEINFNDSVAFNRYESMDGMRVSNGTTKPSIYITEIKLKKALVALSDSEIEDIFEKEMTSKQCTANRAKLKSKIPLLLEWQTLKALSILLEEGKYDSILFVSKCKETDIETSI
jgi:hypothetical protein